nr:MAG TPA: hypothetical protein [Bacteriophage sp.]DAV09210.1 MAG TPA: hypothetical protein [Caudoviricetes sp.]DAX21168.1 MAG TPA: hypothetical protein [Caudoviricetes sp.]
MFNGNKQTRLLNFTHKKTAMLSGAELPLFVRFLTP